MACARGHKMGCARKAGLWMKVQEGRVVCVAQGWSRGRAQEKTALFGAQGWGEGYSGQVLQNSSKFLEFFNILDDLQDPSKI